MFFKKKTNTYQLKLEEALMLVERSTRLVSPYLYDKDYQPMEVDILLLNQLQKAYKQAYAFTGHIYHNTQRRAGILPTPTRHSVIECYTSS